MVNTCLFELTTVPDAPKLNAEESWAITCPFLILGNIATLVPASIAFVNSPVKPEVVEFISLSMIN
jgi:hypothetical protein